MSPGSQTADLQTGVVGLGAMGAPMARNLHAAGLLGSVWNRTGAVAERLAEELGVTAANSPAELAGCSDVVIVCVSADRDVLEVSEQLLPGLRSGVVVVDTSTVNPNTARAVSEQVGRRGAAFIDAPVSGGVEGAVRGTLSVMAGGDFADIERIMPVLDAIAGAVTHMGPVGAGQATKAVNQVMVAGIAEAVCEALALSEKLNLPSERLLKVLGAGAAGSWFLQHRGESMLQNRFDTGFKPALLLKDLHIVRELARDLDMELGTVEAAISDYETLVEGGSQDRDISGLIRLKRTARRNS